MNSDSDNTFFATEKEISQKTVRITYESVTNVVLPKFVMKNFLCIITYTRKS